MLSALAKLLNHCNGGSMACLRAGGEGGRKEPYFVVASYFPRRQGGWGGGRKQPISGRVEDKREMGGRVAQALGGGELGR